MHAAEADSCISAETGNFPFFRTAHFCCSSTHQTQLVWIRLKARSDYTANLLRPAIDGCKIENFPNFRSDLQRPSPLRQSQRPATSVNKPLTKLLKILLALHKSLQTCNKILQAFNQILQALHKNLQTCKQTFTSLEVVTFCWTGACGRFQF